MSNYQKYEHLWTVDTHTHTIASGHAYNTWDEMVEYAVKRQMEVLCITDHGPAMPGSAHKFYHTNLRVIKAEFPMPSEYVSERTKIVKGMEANIIDYDGNTDYDDMEDTISDLKYIIASFHSVCLTPGTEKQNTDAYIKASEKPYVSTIGHIDDGKIPCDYEAVVKAAKKNNVLIELNNSSQSPNSFRKDSEKNALEYLRICKEQDAMIILGSDAHYKDAIGRYENLYPLLAKVDFPVELIMNRKYQFKEWLLKKYEKRLKSGVTNAV